MRSRLTYKDLRYIEETAARVAVQIIDARMNAAPEKTVVNTADWNALSMRVNRLETDDSKTVRRLDGVNSLLIDRIEALEVAVLSLPGKTAAALDADRKGILSRITATNKRIDDVNERIDTWSQLVANVWNENERRNEAEYDVVEEPCPDETTEVHDPTEGNCLACELIQNRSALIYEHIEEYANRSGLAPLELAADHVQKAFEDLDDYMYSAGPADGSILLRRFVAACAALKVCSHYMTDEATSEEYRDAKAALSNVEDDFFTFQAGETPSEKAARVFIETVVGQLKAIDPNPPISAFNRKTLRLAEGVHTPTAEIRQGNTYNVAGTGTPENVSTYVPNFIIIGKING